MKLNLQTILASLPAVGPIIAAAPAFKALFDAAVEALSPEDQATAKEAYELAIDDAEDAHTKLQDLVGKYG